MNLPKLVVLTGRPGSGKTTLAEILSKETHCPVLIRDKFKEGYVNTTGIDHKSLGPDINRKIYEIFFNTVEVMLKNDISLIVEAAFQHNLWETKLNQLSKISKISIIVCSVDPETARSRIIERGRLDPSREKYHGDRANLIVKNDKEIQLPDYQPPKLSFPTLNVDCSNGYQPELVNILNFINL